MTKAKSTRKPRKTQPATEAPKPGLTNEDVIWKLENALNGAEQGLVDGVLIIIHTTDGMNQVCGAGWYKDHPEESLRPAISGMLQACRSDEQAARVEKPAEVVQWYH